jgi:hypothetical protein
MTANDKRSLDSIIGRIEALENRTADVSAKSRLRSAKDELLRLYSEQRR